MLISRDQNGKRTNLVLQSVSLYLLGDAKCYNIKMRKVENIIKLLVPQISKYSASHYHNFEKIEQEMSSFQRKKDIDLEEMALLRWRKHLVVHHCLHLLYPKGYCGFSRDNEIANQDFGSRMRWTLESSSSACLLFQTFFLKLNYEVFFS